MTFFVLGCPPLTWEVTSRIISETATPSWSSSGFKPYLFEVTISVPDFNSSMPYSYYAPPHYVSQHRVCLGDDDHRFIFATFLDDVVNGDLPWIEFLATTAYAGDPRAIDFYILAEAVSSKAKTTFRLSVRYFKEILDELLESKMPDFTDPDKSAFRDVKPEG